MHFSSALTSYSIKGNVSVFIKVERGLLVCRLERNKFARLKKRLEGLEQIMGIKEKAIFVVFRCLFRSITFSFGFFLLFSSIFHLFTSFLTTWTLYLLLPLSYFSLYFFSPAAADSSLSYSELLPFLCEQQSVLCFLWIFLTTSNTCVCEKVTHCMILMFILILPNLFRF